MSTADDLPVQAPPAEDDTAVPEFAQATDKPEGPAAAAILAGGIGCFLLGLLTTLAEASETIAGWLELKVSVGPLSGKTSVTVVVWLVVWAVLHAIYRRRAQVNMNAVFVVSLVLIGLGVIGTFPIFFQLFLPEE